MSSTRLGKYVVWPEDILDQRGGPTSGPNRQQMLSSTKLGAEFGMSASKVNKLLSEIGWIQKGVKGWNITAAGERVGGIEHEHTQSGVPFVKWPESVVQNSVLIENVNELEGIQKTISAPPPTASDGPPSSQEAKSVAAFREKYKAQYRATDGHYVRSRAELAIDNWLYMAGLVHAYERKLPIEEDVYCDFYLPQKKVYIEFWGMEDDPRYRQRKARKVEIYRQNNYSLIELTNEDILSLDDILPRKLLKFGIRAD